MSRDPVVLAVEGVRRSLARALAIRAGAQALGAALATWLLHTLIMSSVGSRFGAAPGARIALPLIDAVLAFVAVLWWVTRGQSAVSMLRAALWIEERAGSGFALVTWIEQALGDETPNASLGRIVARASAPSLERAREALPRVTRKMWMGPLLFAIGAAAVVLVATQRDGVRSLANAVANGVAGNSAAKRAAPIAAWTVQVTPPAYTGLPARSLGDASSIRALSGTRISIVASDAAPDSVRVRSLVDSAIRASDSSHVAPKATLAPTPSGWTSQLVATSDPLEVRVDRDTFARLLLVEGIADSVPRALLKLPARDSVMRKAVGRLPLQATLHDDLGLQRASFEVVVSSGDGERFTVKSITVGARSLGLVRDATLSADLDLTSLGLQPGDVVHLRAVARDAHPSASREAGASDTRSFRIARASEYDSVAVEPAPPPEVDKSLLSQRMLLMLTEKLEARRPRISRDALHDESRTLARDQARLRQAVGDAVFQRLSGEAGGEHSHFAGDGHEHGVDAVDGKLALSGVNAQGMLEEGDDAPVLAINKPLLEAYNAMWDAGRALEQSEPKAAIPFMRLALAAIERARAASRLYLRGKPPTVIIDIAKVRLAGKDTGAVNDRIARLALPSRSAAREARLLSSASLIPVNPLAARDSLAVLRLESLADAPAFAEALSSLIEAVNVSASRSKRTDVTEQFIRARRVLGGIERVPSLEWSRGGPP